MSLPKSCVIHFAVCRNENNILAKKATKEVVIGKRGKNPKLMIKKSKESKLRDQSLQRKKVTEIINDWIALLVKTGAIERIHVLISGVFYFNFYFCLFNCRQYGVFIKHYWLGYSFCSLFFSFLSCIYLITFFFYTASHRIPLFGHGLMVLTWTKDTHHSTL